MSILNYYAHSRRLRESSALLILVVGTILGQGD
jgi:hypothetical protein